MDPIVAAIESRTLAPWRWRRGRRFGVGCANYPLRTQLAGDSVGRGCGESLRAAHPRNRGRLDVRASEAFSRDQVALSRLAIRLLGFRHRSGETHARAQGFCFRSDAGF